MVSVSAKVHTFEISWTRQNASVQNLTDPDQLNLCCLAQIIQADTNEKNDTDTISNIDIH